MEVRPQSTNSTFGLLDFVEAFEKVWGGRVPLQTEQELLGIKTLNMGVCTQ